MAKRDGVVPWVAAAAIIVAFAGCGKSPTEPNGLSAVASVTAKVAQAAAAVTGQDAPMANAAEQGSYVGFDTHTYPGTVTMTAWKKTPGSPYSWVGYYLPSPCHADKSWTGKRDTLQSMGWGLAVVYVGQQTWGKTPHSLTDARANAVRAHTPCSADLVSASEGARDADDAIRIGKAEGFAAGTVVFLDIERMEKVPPAMTQYYRAWAARLLADGTFLPGVYTHQHNAAQIFADVQAEYKAAGHNEQPRFWIAGGKGFDTGRAPQDVGFAFAGVWQGVLDVARSVANLKLPVDVNVASWMSPSDTAAAVQ